jgi:hypothetical protein
MRRLFLNVDRCLNCDLTLFFILFILLVIECCGSFRFSTISFIRYLFLIKIFKLRYFFLVILFFLLKYLIKINIFFLLFLFFLLFVQLAINKTFKLKDSILTILKVDDGFPRCFFFWISFPLY